MLKADVCKCHQLCSSACYTSAGDARWGLELLLAHIGAVLGESLQAQPVQPLKYEKALKLLQGMHGLSSTSARWFLHTETVASC